jgi:NTP pyrophosphatase (non-canonical NTP hydrolase)
MNFAQLQAEQRAWCKYNFPSQEAYHPLLGIIEEVGELAHAHLKGEQHIRIGGEHISLIRAAKKDAIGDIVIFLAGYCNAHDFDFDAIIEATWAHVQKRDWHAFPTNGETK